MPTSLQMPQPTDTTLRVPPLAARAWRAKLLRKALAAT